MSFKHGLLFLAIAAFSLPGCSSHKTVNTPVSGQPGAITPPTASATPVAAPVNANDTASPGAGAGGTSGAATSGKTIVNTRNNGKGNSMNGGRTASNGTGDSPASGSQRPGRSATGGQLTSTPDTIYFAFDDFSLSQDDQGALQAVADRMKSNTGISVELLGHTDERGTVNYNLALGERRGQTVEAYLRALGIKADRMEVISYGETKPAADGHDESAWAHNRRVEIHLQTP